MSEAELTGQILVCISSFLKSVYSDISDQTSLLTLRSGA